MNNRFSYLLAAARKSAGYTQEQAAERLNVATRTLAWYEQGRIPPDNIMAHMMRLYDNSALGYEYLSTISEVGRLVLPELQKITGVAAGTMQLHIAIKKAVSVYETLERVCCDDEVDADEEDEYRKMLARTRPAHARLSCTKNVPDKEKEPRGCSRKTLKKLNIYIFIYYIAKMNKMQKERYT